MDSAPRAPRLLTAALAITLAAPVVAGPNMNPAVTMLVGGIAGVVVCGVAALTARRRLSRAVLWALGSGAALALWLTVAALRSGNPAVSFMGTVSQHTGAALWVLIAAWTCAAALLADRRSFREMLAVVSVAGAVFALMGVFEALTSVARGWGAAAGPFENSSSLGAFLAVSLFAAGAWTLSERRKLLRATAVVCAVAILGGMAAAESRSGIVGALVGLLVVALLWLAPRFRVQWVLFALGLPTAGLAVTDLLIAGATGALGSDASRLIASLGTSRDAIWRSASMQFLKEPVLGSGPEQFSAWVAWSFRGGLLKYSGTYDPHNAILGIALGGGVIALLGWALFAGTTTWAQHRVFEGAGRPTVLIPVIAIPSALMASALFAWLTPAAVIAAAALTGALFASEAPAREPSVKDGVSADTDGATRRFAPGTWGVVSLGLATVIVAVLAVPMSIAEWQHSRTEPPGTSAAYLAIYERWPDPSYASLALEGEFATGGDAEAVKTELAVPRGHVAWHVDLALRELFLAQDALVVDPTSWDRFAAAVETGAEADPASPLWYTVGAAQADASGRIAERDAYARDALALDPGPEESAYLEGLIAKE